MRIGVSLALRVIVVSCLILAVTSCSQNSEGPTDPKVPTSGTASTATKDAHEIATADMVVAVGTGKSAVPIEVRFDHAKRPEIGVPLDIVVSVLPTGPVERLQLVFQAQEGLRVTANSNLGPIERPAVGTDIRHVVTVTPRLEGVHTVSAVVLVEASDVSLSRSFAIPLVVAAAPDGAPTADAPDSGEKAAEDP